VQYWGGTDKRRAFQWHAPTWVSLGHAFSALIHWINDIPAAVFRLDRLHTRSCSKIASVHQKQPPPNAAFSSWADSGMGA